MMKRINYIEVILIQKQKKLLIEDNCHRFQTEGTISTIISSYYDDQCEFSREK